MEDEYYNDEFEDDPSDDINKPDDGDGVVGENPFEKDGQGQTNEYMFDDFASLEPKALGNNSLEFRTPYDRQDDGFSSRSTSPAKKYMKMFDDEAEAAAAKIQAAARGKITRKKMSSHTTHGKALSRKPNASSTSRYGQPKVDSDTEAEAATAAKIQAVVRGKITRKLLHARHKTPPANKASLKDSNKQTKDSPEDYYEDSFEDFDNSSLTKSKLPQSSFHDKKAAKIQAVFRGRLTRKSIRSSYSLPSSIRTKGSVSAINNKNNNNYDNNNNNLHEGSSHLTSKAIPNVKQNVNNSIVISSAAKEEDLAVAKIQAAARGKLARDNLASPRKTSQLKSSSSSSSSSSNNNKNKNKINHLSEDKAAERIQAVARGKFARKKVVLKGGKNNKNNSNNDKNKNKNSAQSSDLDDDYEDSFEDFELGLDMLFEKNELIKRQKELERAAARIQALARGKLARRCRRNSYMSSTKSSQNSYPISTTASTTNTTTTATSARSSPTKAAVIASSSGQEQVKSNNYSDDDYEDSFEDFDNSSLTKDKVTIANNKDKKAAKIQAVFRGKSTRNQVKSKKNQSKAYSSTNSNSNSNGNSNRNSNDCNDNYSSSSSGGSNVGNNSNNNISKNIVSNDDNTDEYYEESFEEAAPALVDLSRPRSDKPVLYRSNEAAASRIQAVARGKITRKNLHDKKAKEEAEEKAERAFLNLSNDAFFSKLAGPPTKEERIAAEIEAGIRAPDVVKVVDKSDSSHEDDSRRNFDNNSSSSSNSSGKKIAKKGGVSFAESSETAGPIGSKATSNNDNNYSNNNSSSNSSGKGVAVVRRSTPVAKKKMVALDPPKQNNNVANTTTTTTTNNNNNSKIEVTPLHSSSTKPNNAKPDKVIPHIPLHTPVVHVPALKVNKASKPGDYYSKSARGADLSGKSNDVGGSSSISSSNNNSNSNNGKAHSKLIAGTAVSAAIVSKGGGGGGGGLKEEVAPTMTSRSDGGALESGVDKDRDKGVNRKLMILQKINKKIISSANDNNALPSINYNSNNINNNSNLNSRDNIINNETADISKHHPSNNNHNNPVVLPKIAKKQTDLKKYYTANGGYGCAKKRTRKVDNNNSNDNNNHDEYSSVSTKNKVWDLPSRRYDPTKGLFSTFEDYAARESKIEYYKCLRQIREKEKLEEIHEHQKNLKIKRRHERKVELHKNQLKVELEASPAVKQMLPDSPYRAYSINSTSSSDDESSLGESSLGSGSQKSPESQTSKASKSKKKKKFAKLTDSRSRLNNGNHINKIDESHEERSYHNNNNFDNDEEDLDGGGAEYLGNQAFDGDSNLHQEEWASLEISINNQSMYLNTPAMFFDHFPMERESETNIIDNDNNSLESTSYHYYDLYEASEGSENSHKNKAATVMAIHQEEDFPDPFDDDEGEGIIIDAGKTSSYLYDDEDPLNNSGSFVMSNNHDSLTPHPPAKPPGNSNGNSNGNRPNSRPGRVLKVNGPD